MFARRFFVGALLAAFSLLPSARSSVLVAEYALKGTLEPTGPGPTLSIIGGQITALGYVFSANTVRLGTGQAAPVNFGLEFSFTFRAYYGDFTLGQFVGSQSAQSFDVAGALQYVPEFSGPEFRDVQVHVVLSHDATANTVTGYVNGQQSFMLTLATPLDTEPLAAAFNFSVRDPGGSVEATGGRIDFVRVYNGTLSSSEAAALFTAAAIPEPSTYVMLGAGAAVLFLSRRRKATRRL